MAGHLAFEQFGTTGQILEYCLWNHFLPLWCSIYRFGSLVWRQFWPNYHNCENENQKNIFLILILSICLNYHNSINNVINAISFSSFSSYLCLKILGSNERKRNKNKSNYYVWNRRLNAFTCWTEWVISLPKHFDKNNREKKFTPANIQCANMEATWHWAHYGGERTKNTEDKNCARFFFSNGIHIKTELASINTDYHDRDTVSMFIKISCIFDDDKMALFG